MSKKSPFNAESLQDIFKRILSGEKTKEDVARYYDVTPGCIGNYLAAKRAYEDGREVTVQTVRQDAFSAWAEKFGGNGEPKYKIADRSRPHRKKEPEEKESDEIGQRCRKKYAIKIIVYEYKED